MRVKPPAPSRYWQLLQEAVHSDIFGTVRLGMSRDEVRECLGDPDDTGGTSRKQHVPRIWKYGEVELHFGTSGELVRFFWDDADGNWIAVDENGSKIHYGE